MVKRLFLSIIMALSFLAALAAQEGPELELHYAEGSDGSYYFYAQYEGLIPAYVWVEFPILQNLQPSLSFPRGFTIPAGSPDQQTLSGDMVPDPPPGLDLPASAVLLFRLDPVPNRSTRFSYQYRMSYPPVDPKTLTHVYAFPFPHGAKYMIAQGYNGRSTHQGQSRYALDFDLELGEPIHAARGGIVVEVKEDSNIGGPSAAFAEDGNYVLIFHEEDGTFANYVHLMQNGSVVQVGQRVNTGDLIGYAGATGQATGPHLHFSIQGFDAQGNFMTIPVKFLGHDGRPVDPVEGKYYYANHPGGEPFEVFFGEDLRDADFAAWAEPVRTGNEVEVRAQTIDATTVLFVRNGTDRQQQVSIQLSLSNMTSTKGNRLNLRVPPNTENYLTILRPRNGGAPYSYGYNWTYQPVR